MNKNNILETFFILLHFHNFNLKKTTAQNVLGVRIDDIIAVVLYAQKIVWGTILVYNISSDTKMTAFSKFPQKEDKTKEKMILQLELKKK